MADRVYNPWSGQRSDAAPAPVVRRNPWNAWLLPAPVAPAPATVAPPTPTLQFPPSGQIEPAWQAGIDQLTALMGQVGGGSAQYHPLDPSSVPTSTPDPGLAALLEHARAREAEMTTLFGNEQKRAQTEYDTRNTWQQRLAQFLGELAASGDLSQAGVIATRQGQGRREQERGLHDQAMRYALARAGYGDQTAEALARSQSGAHEAGERTEDRRFQVTAQNNQGQNQFALANAQNAGEGARARASIGAQIAQLRVQAAEAARQRDIQSAQLFAQVPEYAQQGQQRLAEIAGFQGPTAEAFGTATAQHNLVARGLRAFIQERAASNDSRIRNQLRDVLRDFNPAIRDVKRYGGNVELMLQEALRGPPGQLERALRLHPELAQYAAYAGAPQ